MRMWILVGAILGLTGVAIGAFGAHGLSATLTANGRTATFETASKYHLIHAVAIVAVAALATQLNPGLVQWSAGLLTAGTLVFSGALYILAIFDLRFMGAVTPIGGLLLIAGWGVLVYAAWLAGR
jgi:uncharacterized membrane protein YgdD (TMEM256/DUF423 family)